MGERERERSESVSTRAGTHWVRSQEHLIVPAVLSSTHIIPISQMKKLRPEDFTILSTVRKEPLAGAVRGWFPPLNSATAKQSELMLTWPRPVAPAGHA